MPGVITSYSIHYTKLYDRACAERVHAVVALRHAHHQRAGFPFTDQPVDFGESRDAFRADDREGVRVTRLDSYNFV